MFLQLYSKLILWITLRCISDYWYYYCLIYSRRAAIFVSFSSSIYSLTHQQWQCLHIADRWDYYYFGGMREGVHRQRGRWRRLFLNAHELSIERRNCISSFSLTILIISDANVVFTAKIVIKTGIIGPIKVVLNSNYWSPNLN